MIDGQVLRWLRLIDAAKRLMAQLKRFLFDGFVAWCHNGKMSDEEVVV